MGSQGANEPFNDPVAVGVGAFEGSVGGLGGGHRPLEEGEICLAGLLQVEAHPILVHLQCRAHLHGGLPAVGHGADGQQVAHHPRDLGQDVQGLYPTELEVGQDLQRIGAATLHDGVGEGEGIVFHGGDGGGTDVDLGEGIPPLGADVEGYLIHLGGQGEHVPSAVLDGELAEAGIGLYSVVEVVLLHPAHQLGGGVALKVDGGQVLREGGQQLRGLFGQVARVKGIGGGGDDDQVVGVIGDLGQGLAELVQVCRAKGREVQSRDGYDLTVCAHRGDGQGIQQGGGGEIQAVQADVVEGGHGRLVGGDGLASHAEGGRLHVVLLAEKQVTARGGGFQILAKIRFLENGQSHGLPPSFSALGGRLGGRLAVALGGRLGGEFYGLGGLGILDRLLPVAVALGGRFALGRAVTAACFTRSGLPVFPGGRSSARRAHQALGAKADEIGSPCLGESLANQVGVLGAVELEQGPLELLFVVIGDHVDGLHIQGIDARVEHDGGGGAGGGVVVLDLLGGVVIPLEAEGQVDGLVQGGAGMAGHEVGNQVLLLATLTAEVEIPLAEGLVDVEVGLAHASQNRGGAMLGGDLQLTRYVILHQLTEEGVVGIGQQVVEADARADEYLFHLGQSLDGLQKLNVLGMVGDEVGAGLGGEALTAGAHAALQLLPAGGVAEVCGRAAHVVDVALKIRHLGDLLGLGHHGFDAAGADGAALVEGQGAKVAGAEAAAVVGHGEAHLLNTGHAPVLLVGGVVGAGVGQGVDGVQLFSLQGGHGGILHQELAVVDLADSLAIDGVLILVLDAEGLGVLALIGLEVVVVKGGGHGEVDGIPFLGFAEIDGTTHVADLADGHALIQELCDATEDVLAHTVGQNVGAAVHQDGAAHLIVPVVVVGEAAERGLQAADDDGHVAVGLADAIAVHDGGAVGAVSHLATRRVVVVGALALGGGVVGHHGVDVARRYQKAQTRSAVLLEGFGAPVIGLGQNGHAEALGLQHTGDNGHAKGGVIHVGVTRYVYEVGTIPPAGVHVGAGEGKEVGLVGHRRVSFRKDFNTIYIVTHFSGFCKGERGEICNRCV